MWNYNGGGSETQEEARRPEAGRRRRTAGPWLFSEVHTKKGTKTNALIMLRYNVLNSVAEMHS